MPKQLLPAYSLPWSPDLAYVVGLLVTDGHLSSDGRHIVYKSIDRDLVQSLRRALPTKNSVFIRIDKRKGRKPAHVLQFSDVRFYRWLLSIGVTPRKTLTIGDLPIPPEFFRDFLRGHLDGDGSIFSYQDRYNVYKGKRYRNTRIYTKFISASETHIRWLYEMIQKYSPIQGALLYKPATKTRVRIWEIKIAKYESLKLFRWLYYRKNLPSLSRKRLLAERFLKRMKNGKLIR